MSLKSVLKRWVEAEAKKMVVRNHRTKEADAEAAAEYRLAQAHEFLRSVPLLIDGATKHDTRRTGGVPSAR